MEDRFKPEKEKKKNSNKKQKQKHPNYEQQQQTTTTSTTATTATNISFKPSSDVKGLKFGGQFIVKSFTVRRTSTRELSLLLNHNQNQNDDNLKSAPQLFPSTISFIPTNFTILAHHAWHTLTLGLGTKKSKVIIFVFDTITNKSNTELTWPSEIPLGEVNKRLIRGLATSEIARFKFRKGCVTFYVFGVRKKGAKGFQCGEDLRQILQLVVQLKDFLDHTVMLALPNQRSINYSTSSHSHSVAAH
ncbi:hypothetical protein RND81_10G129800 [Saponaria officinalis]|uniref:DUF7851 domain-containing protein n=1 Tax=Saponaria officinalis TaxID=3572 RepID=A0AAW1I1G9_SAPOF